MTVISLPHAALAEPQPAAAPIFYPAPDAFSVLRSWQAWAAGTRDFAPSGFILLRAGDGPNEEDGRLLLASEDLDAAALNAIGLYSHQRPVAVAAPRGASALLADRATPKLTSTLRALDDWAIEILLRTGAEVTRSLLVGLRHEDGRFELTARRRGDVRGSGADVRVLRDAMSPWIER